MQVYTRLNHLNVCLSYPATLRLLSEVAELHKVPIHEWIASEATFKFVGDNVDKKVGVRDMRSDHQGSLVHMYSMLAVRSRLPPVSLSQNGVVANLRDLTFDKFLPSDDDLQKTKRNLVVLVSRVLTHYIEALKPLSKAIPGHILHQYSEQMSKKSHVAVLDVLMKNEACSTDMIDIMKTMQSYLGDKYPSHRPVASGGDQLTCERQAASQRHMMDSNTPAERLKLLEPQSEDWHTLVCLLGVSLYTCVCVHMCCYKA